MERTYDDYDDLDDNEYLGDSDLWADWGDDLDDDDIEENDDDLLEGNL